jgi:hypothetical protein
MVLGTTCVTCQFLWKDPPAARRDARSRVPAPAGECECVSHRQARGPPQSLRARAVAGACASRSSVTAVLFW